MFRSIGAKDRLVDRIVNEIQFQIFDGGLRPGTLLPSEQELCEHLGVSRTPLREAVRMLVTKGLLETRPGVGTIVKKIRSNQISESISFMLNQDNDLTLMHLHNVRRMLEVENARLAAERATSENIRYLHAINQEMRATVGDIGRFSMLDAEFHRTLAVSTQNPLLAILLELDSRHFPGYSRTYSKLYSPDGSYSSRPCSDHYSARRTKSGWYSHGHASTSQSYTNLYARNPGAI